jgi:hypothetical protein
MGQRHQGAAGWLTQQAVVYLPIPGKFQPCRGEQGSYPEKGGARPINIPDEILTLAKESMFRLGECPPIVFVRGTKHKVYMPLPVGDTSTERVTIMTQAGIQLAQSGEVGEVEQVIYVCEGWSSPARMPFIRPSRDPNRTEVLVISALDANTNTQTPEMYACIRDTQQAVIDLKRLPLPEDVKKVGFGGWKLIRQQ